MYKSWLYYVCVLNGDIIMVIIPTSLGNKSNEDCNIVSASMCDYTTSGTALLSSLDPLLQEGHSSTRGVVGDLGYNDRGGTFLPGNHLKTGPAGQAPIPMAGTAVSAWKCSNRYGKPLCYDVLVLIPTIFYALCGVLRFTITSCI